MMSCNTGTQTLHAQLHPHTLHAQHRHTLRQLGIRVPSAVLADVAPRAAKTPSSLAKEQNVCLCVCVCVCACGHPHPQPHTHTTSNRHPPPQSLLQLLHPVSFKPPPANGIHHRNLFFSWECRLHCLCHLTTTHVHSHIKRTERPRNPGRKRPWAAPSPPLHSPPPPRPSNHLPPPSSSSVPRLPASPPSAPSSTPLTPKTDGLCV